MWIDVFIVIVVVVTVIMFICHCGCTMTYEQQQNYLVTTRTRATTNRSIYINCPIILFQLVLLLLCNFVVVLVQL